ncbi:1-(5-phosphoribosyl)-5-[(5-phosphoribosylamino)methylideneamino]imidazole-4-carboxamide isomerase [Eubacteriales bacterium OttesenSCG-928-M02]|nr:1-(5-phosphoribosyl)-5-[(5-phosphoribosylamino)methylideneamino]imidazole-4-carboxamide isomerase [Eubacteriales bacterium OttesenSCG-928-M02]
MILFPAIDMKDGKCVRLIKGDFNAQTTYGDDPVATARNFYDEGAEWIHVVDLDGAKDGIGKNRSIIGEIAALGKNIQTGGGIRSLVDVDALMALGVARCIIGTAAVENPAMVADAVKKYPGKIAVGIDERDGMVATRGWQADSGTSALELALLMKRLGVNTIIHTDITKDGMKQGPSIGLSQRLQTTTGMDVIVSGGVSSLEDIAAGRVAGMYGMILGKALYDGDIDLQQALAMGKEAQYAGSKYGPAGPDNI